MILSQIESDFLRYLITHGCEAGTRLPALSQISEELKISVGKLREQLEVARALGLVDARPRRGLECNEYSFQPAVFQSLIFALNLDRSLFHAYSTLRCQLEIAFWEEAVSRLTIDDKAELLALVDAAWAKLKQERIQIPHAEHRAFHLTIFRRLENPFVSGLLEAYWDAYEAVDLNTYADYTYLTAVWQYHQQIAEAIAHEAYSEARQLHQDHMLLLNTRGVSPNADLAAVRTGPDFSWPNGRGNGANGAETENPALESI
ncbi:MAG: FadR family transcriptional regulator [Caldilineaceae bacterium]|nr:FadR family transcriptional regulator [Caldilineaceae bacterium]